jgi:signal peptidase I
MKTSPTVKLAEVMLRLLVVVVLGLGAKAGAEVVKGAAMANPVCAVDIGTVLGDANGLAGRIGGSAMRVVGSSMLPYFGDGSVLVVKPVDFSSVRAGAVVVYRNRFGELVSHRLETRVAGGWVARGANNRANDSTLVTADNLVAEVYVTLRSDARGAGLELAAAVKTAPVVLAASAR